MNSETCCVCDSHAGEQCQRCRQPYCSKECQEIDWQQHKLTCSPMPRLVKKQNNSMRPPQPATFAFKSVEQEVVQSNVLSGSVFDNPFKRNSKNIGFQSNDLIKAVGLAGKSLFSDKTTKKTEIKKVNERIIKDSDKGNKTKPVVLKSFEQMRNPITVPVKTIAAAEPMKTSITQPKDLDSITTSTKLLLMTKPAEEDTEPQPQEITTMNDIQIIPIPVGKKVCCMDFSNIKKGYISACACDMKAVAFVDKMCSKITDYCLNKNESYCPQVKELCLCRYQEDQQWYRAEVQNVTDSTFEIEFIDFGNRTTVKSSNIRKMPEQFKYHCLVSKCYIKHFPEDPSDEYILKMATFFNENNIFEVKDLQLQSGRYFIEI